MVSKTDRKAERIRRHKRVRNKISGTAECPRLCVYRSNCNIYVQIIDDDKQVTLASASTLDKEIKVRYLDSDNYAMIVYTWADDIGMMPEGELDTYYTEEEKQKQ